MMKLIFILHAIVSVSFSLPTSKVSNEDTVVKTLENKRFENDLPKFLLINDSTSALTSDFIVNAGDSAENEGKDEVLKITDAELMELRENVTSEVFESIKFMLEDRIVNVTNQNNNMGEVALKSLIENAFKKVIKFVDDNDQSNLNKDVDDHNVMTKKLTSNLNELLSSNESVNSITEKDVLDSLENDNRDDIEIAQMDEDFGSNENTISDSNSVIPVDEFKKQVIVFDYLSTPISNNTAESIQDLQISSDSDVGAIEISTDRIATTSNNKNASALSFDKKSIEEKEYRDTIEVNLKPLAFSDYELELTTENSDKLKNNEDLDNDSEDIKELEEIAENDISVEVQEFAEPHNEAKSGSDNDTKKEQQSKIEEIQKTTSSQSKIASNSLAVVNSNKDLKEEHTKTTNGEETLPQGNRKSNQISSQKKIQASKNQNDETIDELISFKTATTQPTEEHSAEEMHDVFISLLEDATEYTATPMTPRENVNTALREDSNPTLLDGDNVSSVEIKDDGVNPIDIKDVDFNPVEIKDNDVYAASKEDDVITSSVRIFESTSTYDDDMLEITTQPNYSYTSVEILEEPQETSRDPEQELSIDHDHLDLTTELPVKDKTDTEEIEDHDTNKKNQDKTDNRESFSDQNDSLIGLESKPDNITPSDSTTMAADINIEEDLFDTTDITDSETKLRELDEYKIESTTHHPFKDDKNENDNDQNSLRKQEQVPDEVKDVSENSNTKMVSTNQDILLSDDIKLNDRDKIPILNSKLAKFINDDKGVQSENEYNDDKEVDHDLPLNKENEKNELTQTALKAQSKVPSSRDENAVTESPDKKDDNSNSDSDDNEKLENNDDGYKKDPDQHNDTEELRNDRQQQMTGDDETFKPLNAQKSVISGKDEVTTAEPMTQMNMNSAIDGKNDDKEDSSVDNKQQTNDGKMAKDDKEVLLQKSMEANLDTYITSDVNVGENKDIASESLEVGKIKNYDLETENSIETSSDTKGKKAEQKSTISKQGDLIISDKQDVSESLTVTDEETAESTTHVNENDLAEIKTIEAFDESEKKLLESSTDRTLTTKLDSDGNVLNASKNNDQQLQSETEVQTTEVEHSHSFNSGSDTTDQFKQNSENKNFTHDEQLSKLSVSQNEINFNFENANANQQNENSSQVNHQEIKDMKEENYSALNPLLNNLISASNENTNSENPNSQGNVKPDAEINDSESKNFDNNENGGNLMNSLTRNELKQDETLTNDSAPQITKNHEILSTENKDTKVVDGTSVSPEVVSALLEIFNNVLTSYNITLSDDATTKAKAPLPNKNKSSKLRVSNKVRSLESSAKPVKLSNVDNSKNIAEKNTQDGKNRYVIIDVDNMLKISRKPKTTGSSFQSKDYIPELSKVMGFESTRIEKPKENDRKENKVAFIPIIKQVRTRNSNGEYSFMFESADGTYRSETGKKLNNLNGALSQEGEYSFLLPNGERFNLKYIADEAGFQPESDYIPGSRRPLPVQPPIQKVKRRKLPRKNLRARKQ